MPTSFELEEIANFDARRGLTRCAVPGIGMRVGRLAGSADFWRTGAGDMLVRFESTGYRYSFCARTESGAAIAEDQFDEFMMHVGELLFAWLRDGVDDVPET